MFLSHKSKRFHAIGSVSDKTVLLSYSNIIKYNVYYEIVYHGHFWCLTLFAFSFPLFRDTYLINAIALLIKYKLPVL